MAAKEILSKELLFMGVKVMLHKIFDPTIIERERADKKPSRTARYGVNLDVKAETLLVFDHRPAVIDFLDRIKGYRDKEDILLREINQPAKIIVVEKDGRYFINLYPLAKTTVTRGQGVTIKTTETIDVTGLLTSCRLEGNCRMRNGEIIAGFTENKENNPLFIWQKELGGDNKRWYKVVVTVTDDARTYRVVVCQQTGTKTIIFSSNKETKKEEKPSNIIPMRRPA